MRGYRVSLIVMSIVALVLSACAPSAPASPTAAPAKPAEAPKPAATAAPAAKPAEAKPAASPAAAAKPAEAKPAASPAAAAKPAEAKPAASPAAKPAEAKPAASPAAKPEAIVVPKPSGNLAFKIAASSAAGVNNMPMYMTIDRLNAQGWKIEPITFASVEVATESVSKGETQIGHGSADSALLAIQKGARMTLLGHRNLNEWVLTSKAEIQRCQDLTGKKVAHHSPGDSLLPMLRPYLDGCGAKPELLVISGSENRAAALLAGQIDASPTEMGDWVNIDTQAPGKFRILVNFAESLPDLLIGTYNANTDWLQREQAVATAFFAEQVKTHRMVAANPNLLTEPTMKYVPAIKAEALPKVIKAYMDVTSFPLNAALTQQQIDYTIKYHTDGGRLQPGLTADKVWNKQIWDDVLKIVGTVPGKL
jgi:NitT/TauT family transport system substrate-binding protein